MNFIMSSSGFAIAYIVLMIPTYVLPYFGSNSLLLNSASAAAGGEIYLLFFFHIAFLAALVFLARLRGNATGKGWLSTFPVAAALFDLMPGLSFIPMIPTIFHIVAIVQGVKEEPAAKRVAVPGR